MPTIVAMTDEAELTLKDYINREHLSRMALAEQLAREIEYKREPWRLKASIDSYLAGNRPSYDRAVALVKILNADRSLLESWRYGTSPPSPEAQRVEKLQERVDELEARLEEVLTETKATVTQLRSVLVAAFPELARQLLPAPDDTL